jgi:hypothetical protein
MRLESRRSGTTEHRRFELEEPRGLGVLMQKPRLAAGHKKINGGVDETRSATG